MKKILFSCIILIVMVACSSVDEPAKMADTDTLSVSAKFLTEDEAVKVARSALVDFGLTKSSRAYSKAEVSLFKKDASRGAESDTTYYVVNFSNGGFAVVSAYRNASVPVLAISEKGKFSEGANQASVEYVSSLASAGIGIGGIQPWRPVPDTAVQLEESYFEKVYTTLETVDQFVPTVWDQVYPYNKFCPMVDGTQVRGVVGCVPLAVGQILAKHREPQSINGYSLNWDKMLAGPTISDLDSVGANDVARLLCELGSKKFCWVSYRLDGTWANDGYALSSFKYMGYKNAKGSSSMDEAVQSVKSHGPVYMRATDARYSGHAWVMDGTMMVQETLCKVYPKSNRREEILYTTLNYAHMNWGWGGDGDGYFVYNQIQNQPKFEVEQFIFDRDFWFIINIY